MPIPDCRIEPMGDFQFAFSIRGSEVTRWCFSPLVPRPYFFPVLGPTGHSLTRMGHPGAPNHDHHRSLWFAHNDLLGQDFWSENKPPRIVQKQWYAIDDADDYARMALELHWLDGHDPKPLARQDLFVTIRPQSSSVATESNWTLELQSDFRGGGEGVAFRQNNFGILGLRVAKSVSVVFGAGKITGSDGQTGEAALFGKPNRWIDYSGPIAKGPIAKGPIAQDPNAQGSTAQSTSTKQPDAKGRGDQPVIEGLTLIDHKLNPAHPTKWHIRDDGWIGPSLSRNRDVALDVQKPLTVRYLLWIHAGGADAATANRLADEFDASPAWQVIKGTRPHHQWELRRKPPESNRE